MVRTAKAAKEIPCAIGFGISGPEQAAAMAAVSDGAIVGSAYMKRIAEYGADAAPYILAFTRQLREAIDAVARSN
ncbi:MAG: tryptophan synthase subunit alpha, partial [Eubacterium sp.]|nr:tryptophan synthase subunit alpha [Eubacterium sp.]